MSLEHKIRTPNTFIGIDESYPYVMGKESNYQKSTIVISAVVSHHHSTIKQGRFYHKIRGRGESGFSAQDVLDNLRERKTEDFRYMTLPTNIFNKDEIPGLNKVQTLELLSIASIVPHLTRKPLRTALYIDLFGNPRIILNELKRLLSIQDCPISPQNIHISQRLDTSIPITNLADYLSWAFGSSYKNGKKLLEEFDHQRMHSQEVLKLKHYLAKNYV